MSHRFAAPDRDDWFDVADGFPRPNWPEIARWVGANVPDAGLADAWHDAARNWLGRLQQRLGADYRRAETRNFLVLAPFDDSRMERATRFLEAIHPQVRHALAGIVAPAVTAKHAVIVFDDRDQYLAYIAHFYADGGEHGMSGGIFIRDGYPHFALTVLHTGLPEAVFTHELIHACLAGLSLPLWLEEGITLSVEHAFIGSSPLVVDRDIYLQHRQFWNCRTIQEFWSGRSFHRADDGQMLSYNLAQVLVHKLATARDIAREQLQAFLAASDAADAGQAAALRHLDLSLGDLAASFLGPGQWEPDPSACSPPSPPAATTRHACGLFVVHLVAPSGCWQRTSCSPHHWRTAAGLTRVPIPFAKLSANR
jgi:hypothetical protein